MKYETDPTDGDQNWRYVWIQRKASFMSLEKKMMNFRVMLPNSRRIMNALWRSGFAYSCEAQTLTKRQADYVNNVYMSMICEMVKGGHRQTPATFLYILSNGDILGWCKTKNIHEFIAHSRVYHIMHECFKERTTEWQDILFLMMVAEKATRF